MIHEELNRLRAYARHYQGSDIDVLVTHIEEQDERIAGFIEYITDLQNLHDEKDKTIRGLQQNLLVAHAHYIRAACGNSVSWITALDESRKQMIKENPKLDWSDI
jgi:excinuclease UvrABC helicase subunit UvrB